MSNMNTTPSAGVSDARTSRRFPEHIESQHWSEVSPSLPNAPASATELQDFRVDLERIRFSPYFARLSAVTQVVPQSGVGPVMHNRLTHSLKVSAVARVIAANLASSQAQHLAYVRGDVATDDAVGAVVARLGGCDTIVAQAGAHAHDLGHPPFGHLGERVLDRVAREQLGLAEGFEGNAQTFRILTSLDTLGRDFPGLNLTAAVRASVLKYPWTRRGWADGLGDETLAEGRPRGVGDTPEAGAEKFSAYVLEAEELAAVRAAFPAITPGQQTIECTVMDLADDIAYAVHDLDDFTRAGVLQQAAVSGELSTWLEVHGALSRMPVAELESKWRRPGVSLELLWRRLTLKDSWIADRDQFHRAVARISQELGDELLSRPYDGGIDSEREVSGFTRRWIEHLRTSIVVVERPHIREGHVRLDQRAWHEVAVLKFVHARFVLERPELAQSQRGMARVVSGLALGFDAWLTDAHDAIRAPRRLLEWVEEATEAMFHHDRTGEGSHRRGAVHGAPDRPSVRQQGRARAILDYVAAFTDQQAIATYRALTEGDLESGLQTVSPA